MCKQRLMAAFVGLLLYYYVCTSLVTALFSVVPWAFDGLTAQRPDRWPKKRTFCKTWCNQSTQYTQYTLGPFSVQLPLNLSYHVSNKDPLKMEIKGRDSGVQIYLNHPLITEHISTTSIGTSSSICWVYPSPIPLGLFSCFPYT